MLTSAIVPAVIGLLTLIPVEDHPPDPFLLADQDPAKVELVAETIEPIISTAMESFIEEINTEVLSAEAEPVTRTVWDDLADCESGNWLNGGTSFEEGSARWYWGRPGTEVPPWGTTIHHGGLQFLPSTWVAFKPDGYPAYAYDATREQQIVVAERVLAAQTFRAWPVCSQKLGLR